MLLTHTSPSADNAFVSASDAADALDEQIKKPRDMNGFDFRRKTSVAFFLRAVASGEAKIACRPSSYSWR